MADGMKSNECSGVSQPAPRACPTGASSSDHARHRHRGPRAPAPQRAPARVQVEELLAGGASYDGEHRVLPPGAGNWELRFTALSFLAPQRVQFKYRLVGFDDDWVDAGTRRSAFYTQVPPGTYDFEVRAANNDGVWSETPARTVVTMRPHFHQTRAFYAIVAASLLMAGALGYAMHVRGLHARRRELERLVQERTRALTEQQRLSEEARAEAERQRENAERQKEIAERQKEIAQQATAVKTELLQIAAHDLKNRCRSCSGTRRWRRSPAREQATVEFVSQNPPGAERMLGILTRLLDASAMDAGNAGAAAAAHRPRRRGPARRGDQRSGRPAQGPVPGLPGRRRPARVRGRGPAGRSGREPRRQCDQVLAVGLEDRGHAQRRVGRAWWTCRMPGRPERGRQAADVRPLPAPLRHPDRRRAATASASRSRSSSRS